MRWPNRTLSIIMHPAVVFTDKGDSESEDTFPKDFMTRLDEYYIESEFIKAFVAWIMYFKKIRKCHLWTRWLLVFLSWPLAYRFASFSGIRTFATELFIVINRLKCTTLLRNDKKYGHVCSHCIFYSLHVYIWWSNFIGCFLKVCKIVHSIYDVSLKCVKYKYIR